MLLKPRRGTLLFIASHRSTNKSLVGVFGKDLIRLPTQFLKCFFFNVQILLVSSSKYQDRWVVPGGGIEPQEEPKLAAEREALEEAGAKGLLGRLLGIFEVCLVLTLSQTTPGFHMSAVQVFGKHWEKDKLLVISNFSFSHCFSTHMENFLPFHQF